MQTFYRVVKHPVKIVDGDLVFELKVGENVLTSALNEEKQTVTVFKSCWVPIPIGYFEQPPKEFTPVDFTFQHQSRYSDQSHDLSRQR